MGLVAACGGNAFVLGGGPTPDAALDVGQESGPGAPDGPVMTSTVFCGPAMKCDTKPICCTGVNTGISCADSPGGCGCVTRLACASDGNCPAAQPVCCIRSVADPMCGGSVFLATCNTACAVGTRLCDPAAPACPGNKACSTDSGKLQDVGLPQGQGFGVCGN